MPTKFKNELYFPDASAGEIETITTLQVWDCVNKKWKNSDNVVLRNTLLHGMHPFKVFCIGEIPTDTKNPSLLNPFKPNGNFPLMKLDMASNSRNHGRFTFCEQPVGSYYYGGEKWKRVIYGSIAHTGCKKLTYYTTSYAICDDENRDEDGDQFDCPPLNWNFQTGDSHGKAGFEFMQMVEEFGVSPTANPMQYRSALFGKWVGKGTVAYSELNDFKGIGFAQPWSSMKGRKPSLGSYNDKLLIGKVFTAERRTAKAGWMLFQWFTWEILEKDGIITKIEKKCQEIVNAYDNIQNLAQLLRIEQDKGEAEISNPEDNYTSIAEYENMMIRIIRADIHGILLLHPYVVRRIEQRIQSYWLNLAKSAGVKFYSVMTMPDEHFASYYAVNADGRIVGGKYFCAPDFDEGQYIVFANPMRHWGDVQLWTNVWEGDYVGDTGVLATGKDLLLTLGRDTDGDFVQIAKADAYPAITNGIKQFDESPTTEKLPKVALKGTLQEIALGSMNDLTGVVASLLGRAKASNVHHHILNIPAEGKYYPEEKEQTIINFLSQQLQIAVDSLKSAFPNNNGGLEVVKQYLDDVEKDGIPWLADFKSPDVYRNRPCNVNADAEDTISRLVKLVNSYFTAPSLEVQSDPRDYIDTLFTDAIPTQFQLDYAYDHRSQYWSEMKEAIKWRDENDHDSSKIREVAEKAKASRFEIYETKDGTTEFDRRTWVRAYWIASHDVNSGDAGLVFLIFPDEIVTELQSELEILKIVELYAVQYSNLNAPNYVWNGQEVTIRVYIKNVNGKQYKAVEAVAPFAQIHTGWQHLGLVGAKSRGTVPIGTTKTMAVFTLRRQKSTGLNSAVLLFDPTIYTRAEMQDIVIQVQNKSFKWR